VSTRLSEPTRLAALDVPASLVLVPRRQARHLNSQLDFLGEVVDVIVHPDDATALRKIVQRADLPRADDTRPAISGPLALPRPCLAPRCWASSIRREEMP
jgi:hypothetical protein